MAHDLRDTLSPIYADLLKKLLSLLPRSISPPVLTCLLETLSSLFRYFLIPSLNLALLDQTWDAISQVLPKCLGEIQRAVAEVWGSCLRRMKKEAREKSVVLLAKRAGDVENTSAWALVFACKVCIVIIHSEHKFTRTSTVYISNFAHIYGLNIYASPRLLPLDKFKYKSDIHTHSPKFDCSSSSCEKCGTVRIAWRFNCSKVF